MAILFTQEADFRQEREFGQKISAAFDFIRVHWRPLGRVLLYTVLPAALLTGVLNSTLQLTMWSKLTAPATAGLRGAQAQLAQLSELTGSPLYWLNLLLTIAFFSLLVLSVYGYVLGCLRGAASRLASPDGADSLPPAAGVSVAEVWRVIRREFVSTYFSIFGIYFLIGVGFFFLVLPGLYLSIMLSLFFIVKLVEGTGFRDTVGRCRQLIRGKWWSTFGLIFVMGLLVWGLFILVGIVSTLLGGGAAVLLRGNAWQSPVFVIVANTLSTGLALLFYPPLLLVLAFQYFNLVERQEGVGLRGLVGQLGQVGPTARNASYRASEEGEY
ncbi:hypothetical protein [uncultured Hymenobacter sp.]|uniref:hypothetical protein n=1 Tax=uncultured Hymenobacter sp. TaxID=170016 RepID=UPI0035C9B77F